MDSGDKLERGVLLGVEGIVYSGPVEGIARKRGGRLKILSNGSMTAVVRSRSGQNRTVSE